MAHFEALSRVEGGKTVTLGGAVSHAEEVVDVDVVGLWANCNTFPVERVTVGERGVEALVDTAPGRVLGVGSVRTCGDTDTGRVVSVGVVGTELHAYRISSISIIVRIRRTLCHTPHRRVISQIPIRTGGNTFLSERISIELQLHRTHLHTDIRVRLSVVIGRTC